MHATVLIGGEAEWDPILDDLGPAGFTARRHATADLAAEALQKERFDALLLDLDVLESKGLSLLQAALRANPDMVAVAVAGPESLNWARQVLAAGACAMLPKPCPGAVLQKTLELCLARQRLSKDVQVRDRALETLNRELDSKIEDATREFRELNTHILSEMASLREVDLLKSAFLGNVTHDLRTPLTTLKGYISFLLDGAVRSDEERAFCLRSAGKALAHMEYLVSHLLEAAQLNSGKIKLDLQQVVIVELLGAAEALIRGQTQANNIRFDVMPDSDRDLAVRGDRGRLTQVLANLLGNACKFTPEGGRIGLRAWSEKNGVHFCVEDSGIGIALEHQARVFDKFYQVDTSRKRAAGLGLGLRIAKELVELHGGRIWVESRPGMGSRFHFVVPREGPPEAQTPSP